MQTRLLTPLLASLLIAAPLACGDNGGGTETASGTGGTTGSGMITTDTPTTTGETPTTGEDLTTTGVDLTTPGETPTTTGDDGTTGEPIGCQAPSDVADEDMDGVLNNADNCRCDPNPNQLDFDGNAVGNVCDLPLRFTIVDGVPPEFNKLDTTATANKVLSCDFPVSLIVISGDVQVDLDDVGTAKIYAARLDFADTPELECDLGLLQVKLRIEKFFADGVDPFTVGFPFTVPDHDAGTISGMTDVRQNILVSGIINVTESSNEDLAPKGQNPIEMVPGAFPPAVASVVEQGNQVSLLFTNADAIVFEQTTMSDIKITLKGLSGTLRLRK